MMNLVRTYRRLARRLKKRHPLRRSVEALAPIEEEIGGIVKEWEALNERQRQEFEKRRELARKWFEEERERLLLGS